MNRFWILFLGLAACGSGKGAPQPRPLTVFAASSLTEAAGDIAREWTRRTGRPVRLEFGGSSLLARQLSEGAPADLFLSAAPEWVDQLRPRARFDWLSNGLVLVVPRDAPDPKLESLASLAMAPEQVPAGRYAREALASLQVPLPARVIYGDNVRDVLSKVSQGGAQAGIVYQTDAAIDPGVRVAFTFPERSHPRILYTAALLTPEGAPLFEALREPWAIELAKRRGFADPSKG